MELRGRGHRRRRRAVCGTRTCPGGGQRCPRSSVNRGPEGRSPGDVPPIPRSVTLVGLALGDPVSFPSNGRARRRYRCPGRMRELLMGFRSNGRVVPDPASRCGRSSQHRVGPSLGAEGGRGFRDPSLMNDEAGVNEFSPTESTFTFNRRGGPHHRFVTYSAQTQGNPRADADIDLSLVPGQRGASFPAWTWPPAPNINWV